MGIQKHRRSRRSGANRRAQWKVTTVALVACPQCHARMRPHRVCANCGYYDGREIIKIEEEEKKK